MTRMHQTWLVGVKANGSPEQQFYNLPGQKKINSISDPNFFFCGNVDSPLAYMCPTLNGDESQWELKYSDEYYYPEQLGKYEYFYIKSNVNPKLVVAPSDTLNNNLNINSRDLILKDLPEDLSKSFDDGLYYFDPKKEAIMSKKYPGFCITPGKKTQDNGKKQFAVQLTMCTFKWQDKWHFIEGKFMHHLTSKFLAVVGDTVNAGAPVVAGNFDDLKSNQWTIELISSYTPDRKPSDESFSDVLEAADAGGGGPGEALKGIGETFGPAGIGGATEGPELRDVDKDCQ